MSLINQSLVSQYDLQLGKLQGALKGHDQATVNALQAWREELGRVSDQEALKAHATRQPEAWAEWGPLAKS